MAYTEQLSPYRLDRDGPSGEAEAAARATLRAQIDRLERELAETVVRGFPHIASGGPAPGAATSPARGRALARVPHVLGLAELERTRDLLVARVVEAHAQLTARRALEQRSRELLRRAREEPRRYKFLRIPAADLGEAGCGVWQVRPRLGPIGMLAGWWEVKLSSGCP